MGIAGYLNGFHASIEHNGLSFFTESNLDYSPEPRCRWASYNMIPVAMAAFSESVFPS